ncbi:MAG TPA: TIR domain-containing protein [Usitatibacter sp.]|nr:TIR domain-containing protein [Usitatibacter sp.]
MDAAKYWAFISYSHQDSAWSDWLFKALETYRVPRRLIARETRSGTVPPRLFPVFRDRDELPGSSELSTNLVTALRASRYLVVICSPYAARSRWVNEEIRNFKAMGGEARILALIVSGEPNATDKPESGMPECFPPALRFRGEEGDGERTEPIAADVRPGKDGKALALLKLVSGIIGVSFDELRQRERERARARNARVALLASAACLAIVLASAWVWVDATIERDVERGRSALMARDFSHAAPALVAAARLQDRQPLARERKYLRAMLGLAMAQVELLEHREVFPGKAQPFHAVNAERTLLAQSLQQGKIVVASLQPGGTTRVFDAKKPGLTIGDMAFDSDGRGLTFLGEEGEASGLQHLDFASGRFEAGRPDPQGAGLWGLAPDAKTALYRFGDHREIVRLADAKVLARFGTPRSSRADDLRVFDRKSRRLVATERGREGWNVHVVDLVNGGIARSFHLDSYPGAAAFDPSGERLAVATGFSDRGEVLDASMSRELAVFDLRDGKRAWRASFPSAFRDLAFSEDGARLIATSGENRAIVWNAVVGVPEMILDDPDAQIREGHFLPDGKRAVTMSQDGNPRVWDLATGAIVAKLDGLGGFFGRVLALPDNRSIAAFRVVGEGLLLRWKLDERRVPHALPASHRKPLEAAGLVGDRSRLVSFDQDAAVAWDARDMRTLARVSSPNEYISFSQDGRLWFASKRDDANVRVGETDSGRVLATRRLAHRIVRLPGWNRAGEVIAVDEDNELIALDATLRMRVLGKFAEVTGIDVAADGRIAITDQSGLEILDGAKGARLALFPTDGPAYNPYMVFSASGDRLLVSYNRSVEVLDLHGAGRHRLATPSSTVATLSNFTCDDRYVAVDLDGPRFQLHDAATGDLLHVFDGAYGLPTTVACDTQADLLMATDSGGYATIWRLAGGAPIAQFKLADKFTDTVWLPEMRALVGAARDSRLYLVPVPLETRNPEELKRSLDSRISELVDVR